MKRSKNILAIATASVLAFALTGCTTIGTNTSLYFSEVADAVDTMLYSKSDAEAAVVEDDDSDKTALSTPEDFTVSEDGSYSFSSVENASYYQLFIYEADAEDHETYISTSEQIEEDGSGTYSGSITESLTYGYGDFEVTVVAYPDYSDTENKKSEEASAEFTNSGEVDEPQFAYYWDCFTGTFDIQLINIANYEYESFPTVAEVTLTNEEDSSDTVTLDIEGISLEDNIYSVSTTELTDGATYDIDVDVEWDETYVTNPSATVSLDPVTISSTASAITEGYGYLNEDIYSSRDYPAVGLNFNVEEGGSMGVWYQFTPYQVSSKGIASYVSFSTTVMDYVATPCETVTDGSLYSYTFETSTSDSAAESFTTVTGEVGGSGGTTGTLEIYEDGTFTASVDYVAGIIDAMTTFASDIQGTWTDNGDGTINLYYDHTSTVLYDD